MQTKNNNEIRFTQCLLLTRLIYLAQAHLNQTLSPILENSSKTLQKPGRQHPHLIELAGILKAVSNQFFFVFI